MPASKKDQLKEFIRRQIRSGEWPPGHKLPSRYVLMNAHNLSITTVRDAEKELATEGWLESLPSVGVYVATNPPTQDAPAE